MNYFEVKVKYEKITEDGVKKMVPELYLVDAVSFSETEERINKEMEPFISGEFTVSAIKTSNYSEVIPSDEFDTWFKCKVTFFSINEESGKELQTSTYILIQSDNAKTAFEDLNKALADCVTEFKIPDIKETKIIDVFNYDKDEE